MTGVNQDARQSPDVDAVVLTALAAEKAAVLAAVGQASREVVRGTGDDVHVVSLGGLRIAVASLLGMGNVAASVAAREVIDAWRPRFVVLVGIAAGLRGYTKELDLGDVLVADQVVGFELAKITAEGSQRRYQSFRPHFDLLAAAHAVVQDEWASMMAVPRPDGLGTPRAYVGTVLSGEKVFADRAGVEEIRRAWPTAVGVEMEGLGVAWAAYRGGCGFLLVKGVSDFADASKDDQWHGYAAEAAARFTLAVLRRHPVTPSSGPRPRQLPRDAAWFTGRDGELERLVMAATDRKPGSAGSALVISAIDGMAGIGKTALAVRAGHRLAGRFPDGQLFVDLHGYTAGVARVGAAEALDRLLRDLGVPGDRIPAKLDERAALWRSLLVGRRMLIVLDNAATEAQVQPLLPGAAGCLVLVTSRRRLAALEATSVLSLDTLPLADAVLLFARTADRPELTIDTPEVLEAVELCGRLPLAIRIAAARLKHRRVWTVADLTLRLRDLDARLAALDDGQRSVHATLHLSYQYLSAEAQRLYRMLGLHPGRDVDPFAAAALGGGGLDGITRILDGLVDDNLLAEPAPGRYVFHDLVRAHAAGLAAGEETQAQQRTALDRLLDHYRHTATAAMDVAYPSEGLRRPTVASALTPTPDLADRDRADRWLDAELANLLAVAQHAAEHGWLDHAWQLPAILDRHLRTRGHYREAEALHQRALTVARHLGNDTAEMNALNGLGHVSRRLGQQEQAGAHYRRALQIAQHIGHRVGELTALHGLGAVHWMLGRYEQSVRHYGDALQIARTTGERVGERQALHGLGDVHWILGRHEQAVRHYGQAFQIAHASGDLVGEQFALTGLGHVHLLLGHQEQAGGHYGRALQIAQGIGDRVGEVNALTGLGHVHLLIGHQEQAGGHFERALQIAQGIGDRVGERAALTGIGAFHQRLGRYGLAGSHFERALQIAQGIGDRVGELYALHGLGDVYRLMGRHNDAAGRYQQVLDLAGGLGNANWQFAALQGLGRLYHASGQPGLALNYHERALRFATDLAQPADQARAHDGLAHAHHTLNGHDQARLHWQHALDILTSLGTDYTEEIQANVQSIRAHLTSLNNEQEQQPPS